MSRLAFFSFYIGTASVWGAVMVFLSASFDEPQNYSAAVAFVCICCFSLVASFLLVIRTLSEDRRLVVGAFSTRDERAAESNFVRAPAARRGRSWSPTTHFRGYGELRNVD